jgi:hypothetical protein
MSVAGNDAIAISFSQVYQSSLKISDLFPSPVDLFSQKEPEIRRNLIVPAPAGVQLVTRIPYRRD